MATLGVGSRGGQGAGADGEAEGPTEQVGGDKMDAPRQPLDRRGLPWGLWSDRRRG